MERKEWVATFLYKDPAVLGGYEGHEEQPQITFTMFQKFDNNKSFLKYTNQIPIEFCGKN